MSWAKKAVGALQRGESIEIQPKGNSMSPIVKNGATVLLAPVPAKNLKKGDVVLVRVNRRVYLHLIKAIGSYKFLIGNNRGGVNGWVAADAIYGKAVRIDN